MPVTTDSFGFLIAYLIPGFLLLWGLGPSVPLFREWLSMPTAAAPTVGSFLFATIASMAAGLLLSAIRWAIVDRLYHRTGIPEPRWNFAAISDRLPAFEGIVTNHYRFYQAYSNALVALLIVYIVSLGTRRGEEIALLSWDDVLFVVVASILILASRDCLRKYYARANDLMSSEGGGMFNRSRTRKSRPHQRDKANRAQ